MLSTCDKEDSTLLFNSLKREEDLILVLRHQVNTCILKLSIISYYSQESLVLAEVDTYIYYTWRINYALTPTGVGREDIYVSYT